mmetsp:Transcript_10519/g.29935  ORF Transcript_10519/g.29935 Transcript_10519/m.29935 type:complete len:233 (-) Transcript_10519:301-999(-)|eukprot:CAMPEP_0117648674 /NCGR_PEP_ID=MMETSP0804-20121206/541_1 /TAXON_ID=1074897 /ORGANISM="Tetraselmis astigmatica, Strain CCMP880" /LENGTH=232 /DNA_ID=CAMNT_0005454313 /DNA_START=201 /DNA_END=899 /DNA_ORIENTATION=-
MARANSRLAFVLTFMCIVGTASGRRLFQAKQTESAVTATPTPTPKPDSTGIVGNDVDAHGCKPSAGYRWCPVQNQCVGPDEPCLLLGPGPVVIPGGDADAHGCRASAGYQWCPSLQKCLGPDDEEQCAPLSAGGPSFSCPGPVGLMGGWMDASTSDPNTVAAVEFVISAVNPANSKYVIQKACTQVVAGIKYFVLVELVGGGGFEATLLRPLPSDSTADNTPFQIVELAFEN